MTLPPTATACLTERGLEYSVSSEANMTCLVLPKYALPPGYDRERSDLLLRLNPGFPDVPPDMWWFNPSIKRRDGQVVPATEVMELHLGRNWQRWSRHFPPGQWQSGIDNLESFLALIRKELEKWVQSN